MTAVLSPEGEGTMITLLLLAGTTTAEVGMATGKSVEGSCFTTAVAVIEESERGDPSRSHLTTPPHS